MAARMKWLGWRELALLLVCLPVFSRCHIEGEGPVRDENYVTVRLNDSLSKFDRVDITILVAADTSTVIAKIWSGALPNPSAVPSYRLPEGESGPIVVRVRAFDAQGRLVVDMLVSNQPGQPKVVSLLPPVVPIIPDPIKPDTVKPDTVKPDTGGPAGKDPFKNWKNKVTVAIQANNLGMARGSMVRDFPLLVRLNKDNFDFTKHAESLKEIRFAKADGTLLPHELIPIPASINAIASKADIWVKVDTIRAEDNPRRIYMYWGNPAAASTSDGAKVFGTEAGHSGVWHLGETANGEPGEFKDAVGRYPGTGGTGDGRLLPGQVEGVVGFGQDFRPGFSFALEKGAQGIISLPKAFDPGPETWTFQVWVKREMDLKTGVLFQKGDDYVADQQRFEIKVEEGGASQLSVLRANAVYHSNVYLTPENFTHLGIVYTGNRAEIYIDGFFREAKAWTQGTKAVGNALMGADVSTSDMEGFCGTMDEMWFASIPRSAEWMRLSYENQKTGSTLVSLQTP